MTIEKKQSAIFFKKLSTIKCGDCGHIVSKDEALELEYCSECEACLDIPNEWIEELE
tara:strand:+ start:14 stop:184 length:171 start_codon:yes stop_codon:yes gene_type:complete